MKTIENIICVVKIVKSAVREVSTYIVKDGDKSVIKAAEKEFVEIIKTLNPNVTERDILSSLDDGVYVSPRSYDEVYLVWSDIKSPTNNARNRNQQPNNICQCCGAKNISMTPYVKHGYGYRCVECAKKKGRIQRANKKEGLMVNNGCYEKRKYFEKINDMNNQRGKGGINGK